MRAICRRKLLLPSLVLALVLTGAPTQAAAAPAADPYASIANWLCRPDKSDPCDSNLNATAVHPNGTTTVESWAPDRNAPVDCFYVYPTSSWDLGTNSDRYPGTNQEVAVTRTQAARFGSVCRVYAPIYRSVTATWLVSAYLTATSLDFPNTLVETAYSDVRAAFLRYLSVDNGGRGFVLMGHSQGSLLLSRLFREEIAPNPAVKAKLVSALFIGLPGGDHPAQSDLPSCTSASQTGCHLAYTSFRVTRPPAPGTLFAASTHPHDCTNPAALATGGPSLLRSYFPTAGHSWKTVGWPVTTPFVTLPGLVSGRCVTRDGFTYLEITINANPADPRTDNVPGDLIGPAAGEWGLHLSDVQLAQGDLISVVGQQVAAYQSRR